MSQHDEIEAAVQHKVEESKGLRRAASPPPGKLGILVGGGPAPGINSVIGAATIRGLLEHRQVLGLREGFKWLMRGQPRFEELDYPAVSRIHFQGGSYLGISRAVPHESPQTLARTVQTLQELGISMLITIGGDDTAFSAMQVHRAAEGQIRVVHVPKTIDNDLDLPPYEDTFGYQTARHVGVQLVKNLMTDARTTGRWYLVVSMGRKAGHLALGIGKAAGATLTIIPEEVVGAKVRISFVVDTIVCAILKRRAMGRDDGVAVVAEGILESLHPDDAQLLEGATLDPSGNLRLAEVPLAKILRQQVLDRLKTLNPQLKVSVVEKDIGYELRCADPIPFDLEYTRDLGYCAAKYILGDTWEPAMVSLQSGRFVPILFEKLLDPQTGRTRVRLADINTNRYGIARRYMIRLRRDDFEDQALILHMAELLGWTPEQFKGEFEQLTRYEPPSLEL